MKENIDWETWKSMEPENIRLGKKYLVDNWLFMLRMIFIDTKTSCYSHYRQLKTIPGYWLQYGKHETANGDPFIINCQIMWDEYINTTLKMEKGTYSVRDSWNSKLPFNFITAARIMQKQRFWNILKNLSSKFLKKQSQHDK